MATAYAYTATGVKNFDISTNNETQVKLVSTKDWHGSSAANGFDNKADSIVVKTNKGSSVVVLGLWSVAGWGSNYSTALVSNNNVISVISSQSTVGNAASTNGDNKRLNVLYTYLKVN